MRSDCVHDVIGDRNVSAGDLTCVHDVMSLMQMSERIASMGTKAE